MGRTNFAAMTPEQESEYHWNRLLRTNRYSFGERKLKIMELILFDYKHNIPLPPSITVDGVNMNIIQQPRQQKPPAEGDKPITNFLDELQERE